MISISSGDNCRDLLDGNIFEESGWIPLHIVGMAERHYPTFVENVL